MGAFFGSVQVHGCTHAAVIDAAERVANARGIRCLVGPEIEGWVGVYPEHQGQDQRVGEALAAILSGNVLHLLLHDEDVVAYWLWRNSSLLDSYFSRPGYFGDADRAKEETMRGNADAFAPFLPTAASDLPHLLARDVRMDAMVRFERLARALRLSNAMTSYEYLKAGETRGVRGWKQFRELPAAAVSAEQAARKALAEARRAKKKDGLLLAEAVSKTWGIESIAAAGGLVAAVPSKARPRDREFVRYVPPWRKSELLPLRPRDCCSLATDASCSRLAVGEQGLLTMYATDDWRELLRVQAGIGNRVSLDRSGSLLACRDRDGVEVIRVADGSRLARTNDIKVAVVFDPSGEYLLFRSYPGSGIEIVLARSLEEQRHLQLDPLPKAPGEPAAGLESSENVLEVGFSADGRWLWATTGYALRVYDWASVRAADGRLPAAAHIYRHPDGVSAAAEDVRGGAVLFGARGTLRRLHLGSGRIERLEGLLDVDPPQWILSITVSADGSALGLVLRTWPSAWDPRTLRDNRHWWQIWSYGRLVAVPE
jgi:hypothetical protein